jgi:hypothetical protein
LAHARSRTSATRCVSHKFFLVLFIVRTEVIRILRFGLATAQGALVWRSGAHGFGRSWVSTSRDTEHCSHFSEVRIGGQVLGADCPNDVVVIVAPPKIGFVLACLSFNVGDSLRQWSAQGSGGTGQSAVVGPCCIRFMQSAVSPSWSAVDVGDLARVCAVLPLAQGELDGGCLRSWCALDLWSLTSLDTFVCPLRTGDHSA